MRMMSEITSSFGNLATFSRSKKMEVTKYDGLKTDARTWLVLYERACDTNRWHSDTQKIINLKACLVHSSGADRWYSSRIVQEQDLAWSDWKESFIPAFTQNRIEACRKALTWEYRNGSIMTYLRKRTAPSDCVYQHSRKYTGHSGDLWLTILSLPTSFGPQNGRDDLIKALQTLVPKIAGRDSIESGKQKKPDERPRAAFQQ